jgi:hypothetical protein
MSVNPMGGECDGHQTPRAFSRCGIRIESSRFSRKEQTAPLKNVSVRKLIGVYFL